MIVPIMLVMFFGTVEFSSGVAVDRKVTLMARTLSDLTSQSLSATDSDSVTDTDLQNFFTASIAIMTPYVGNTDAGHDYGDLCRLQPATAKVQWSKAATMERASQATLTRRPTTRAMSS